MEERYQRVQEEKEAGFVETVRPLKRLATGEIVMPMFEPTPEQQKSNEEHYQNLKNEKKRLEAQYRIERDKALEAIGIDHDEDQHLIEKVIEAQNLAKKLEESAVKGAQQVLQETKDF